jgi:futalosine hydrolase
MDLLICAATVLELTSYTGLLRPSKSLSPAKRSRKKRLEVGTLITGVGIPQALVSVLTKAGQEKPQRILNIGIAGAYRASSLQIGDLITADSEVYGDVGMELPETPGFQPLRDTPFGMAYREPYTLVPCASQKGLAVGRGCTVNSCTGTEATGGQRQTLFEAAFETMEGAAVAQAGAWLGIPVSEIRAISNIAAARDMRPENIVLALDSLAAYFEEHPYG